MNTLTMNLEDEMIRIVGSPAFIALRESVEKVARHTASSYTDVLYSLIEFHRKMKRR